MIGATAMAKLCHRIELLGVSGTTAGSAELITELRERYEATLAALADVAPIG